MKKDSSLDPAPIRQLGALAVVLQTDAIVNAVEKFWCVRWLGGCGNVMGHSWLVLTIKN